MPLLALCALSGILLGAAFPPSPFGLLALIGFVPLLIAIDRMTTLWRRSIVGYLYVTFFLYHGITNWWVMSWQEQTDPYLMASGAALWLGHPFFLSVPFYALASIRRRLGRTIYLWAIPFAIAGSEWLHGQTDASYPWLSSGYMLIDTYLAQIADYVGVYGLTFLIAVVNTALAQWYFMQKASSATARRWLFGAMMLVAVWTALGALNASRYGDERAQPVMSVALVQPNENPWDKWADPRGQVLRQQGLVDSVRREGARPQIAVWAETAIPYTIREAPYQQDYQDLVRWVDTSQVILLTGFADRVMYGPGEAPPSARTVPDAPHVQYDHFNAAMVIQPGNGVVGVHHKSMLTPFAERLPFADYITFAMSWIEWGVGISSWGKGTRRDPLPLMDSTGDTLARIGTVICIESIYPEVASDMVGNGADVLCVITNDAWYNGTWGPSQHFDIARMRAIEQRREVVRCAMSGETGMIRADGSVRNTLEPLKSGVLLSTVHPRTERTVYQRVGDVVPIVGALGVLFLLIATRIPSVVRNMRVHSVTSTTTD